MINSSSEVFLIDFLTNEILNNLSTIDLSGILFLLFFIYRQLNISFFSQADYQCIEFE